MKISQFLLMLTIPCTTSVMAVEPSPSTDNATTYIISPVNGETVSNPVTVIFGLKNMGVAPAGIKKPHTGHHHLLINAGQIPKINQPIPSDDHHQHFGKGQTEVSLTLPLGKNTLQLMLGDHFHIPHNPPVISKKITITVE
tara:strand:+ start:1422 stop:1844 length:423 start_codon:yes stop_codon:yes gene_type:complete